MKHNEDVLAICHKNRGKNQKKMIYVSPGHRISLVRSGRLVKSLTKIGELIPEPIRIADIASRDYDNKEHILF